ncbi:hypothetical protein SMC26_16130 [Actinomadura fulvescens]|uniref:hypothetical protein n=1 Tax=Actinomadura fulvescens TaxID=46160 RepID=UPI0031DFDFE4
MLIRPETDERALDGLPVERAYGDVVGHFHPLTAAGLLLAFANGMCLARSATFQDYRRERAARSRVPELLADALYTVFSTDDPANRALRLGSAARQVGADALTDRRPGSCWETVRGMGAWLAWLSTTTGPCAACPRNPTRCPGV